MPLVSVVIPLYKQIPDKDEKISFSQYIRVLHDYPIVFACPLSLNINFYESLARGAGCTILVERFEDHFFKSIEGYNHLLISENFYKRFKGSEYILIYQLDAFIFKDELKYWCEQGNDFIGAPLFIKWTDPDKTYRFMDGENGGLSLRNVKSSLRILKRVALLKKIKRFYFFLMIDKIISFVKILKLIGWKFNIRDAVLINVIDDYMDNEDYLWSMIFAKGFGDFKVPPPDIALKFSFEVHPSFLYATNNNTLPFGCHAWQKYEPQFWKQFIKQEL